MFIRLFAFFLLLALISCADEANVASDSAPLIPANELVIDKQAPESQQPVENVSHEELPPLPDNELEWERPPSKVPGDPGPLPEPEPEPEEEAPPEPAPEPEHSDPPPPPPFPLDQVRRTERDLFAPIAIGNVKGDALGELIIGRNAGSSSQVDIASPFAVLNQNSVPSVQTSFEPYPFFLGGTFVAAGRVLGTPHDQVITGAGRFGGPHVKVFSIESGTAQERMSFFAYDAGMIGGVRVATGDWDKDGIEEIITVPGPGYPAHVKIWRYNPQAPNSPTLVHGFFAFELEFLGGAFVAAGNVDGIPGEEVLITPDTGGGPVLATFANHGTITRQNVFDPRFTGGVRVASEDVNRDGRDDVIVAAGPGGGPHVRVLSGSDNSELFSYFSPSGSPSGIFPAAFDAGIANPAITIAVGVSAIYSSFSFRNLGAAPSDERGCAPGRIVDYHGRCITEAVCNALPAVGRFRHASLLVNQGTFGFCRIRFIPGYFIPKPEFAAVQNEIAQACNELGGAYLNYSTLTGYYHPQTSGLITACIPPTQCGARRSTEGPTHSIQSINGFTVCNF